MADLFSFEPAVEIGESDNRLYRPGRDGIPTEVMEDPVKKKLWFAFSTAFKEARNARDEVLALDKLKVAVVAAFQEARNARDEALALQKKEELEADRAVATDMVPGADERRKKNGMRKRKKREELEADSVVAADTGQGDDERRGKKNEMAKRKRKKRHNY